MKIALDVTQNILQQFATQLGINALSHAVSIDSSVGKGFIHLATLPNQIELYHFSFTLREQFEVFSRNPSDSEWLLLNINLSESPLEKKVNEQEVNFQKYLPSGMLFYVPQTEVFSISPPNIPFSIALIRFHRSLLDLYPTEELTSLQVAKSAIIYEDLDFQSEELLGKCIESMDKQLFVHAHVLQFLSLFFEKLKNRDVSTAYEALHPQDLKNLFIASSLLRNPFEQHLPSIEDLSKMAGMGTTKFNSSFKQVFGTTPLQYNLKIKMEHAKDQLIRKASTPSEISYQLGYSHPSKFTAAFKKQFGVLPSAI